jgi:hypothetical protein
MIDTSDRECTDRFMGMKQGLDHDPGIRVRQDLSESVSTAHPRAVESNPIKQALPPNHPE